MPCTYELYELFIHMSYMSYLKEIIIALFDLANNIITLHIWNISFLLK